MATHSSTLAQRIPWTEEPGGLQSMGSQESDMTDSSLHMFRRHSQWQQHVSHYNFIGWVKCDILIISGILFKTSSLPSCWSLQSYVSRAGVVILHLYLRRRLSSDLPKFTR